MHLCVILVISNHMINYAEMAADMASCYAQRVLLWQRRNNIVRPFNETVQQVFARISALRDSLDGPQVSPLLLIYPP